LKVVALGDSLTVGESDFPASDEYASYPTHLETLAKEHLRNLQSDLKINVLNKGICGELTSGMLERFSNDVANEEADYVIILGGANDIGWGLDTSKIAHNLTSMYDLAQGDNIVPVACSVPSILGLDDLIPPRVSLNRIIQVEAEKRNLTFLDFFKATTDPHTNRLSENYSADGLHLNTEGYREMGRFAFDGWLRPLLERPLG